jgi:hypothetical protein
VVALVVQVDPVVVREDPADLEDSVDFPVVRVVQAAGREDVAVEGVAGVLQAVEHLTRRKSLK